MNTITLIGRLGAAPEMRQSNSGLAIANFSIAYNNKKGDDEVTTWVRCVAFGDLASNLGELDKGQRVIIQGELQERSYTTKDGEDRKVTEFVLRDGGPSMRFGESNSRVVVRDSVDTPLGAEEPF